MLSLVHITLHVSVRSVAHAAPPVSCAQGTLDEDACSDPQTLCVGQAFPIQTLNEADAQAAPGDTILIAPGLYEAAEITTSGRANTPIRWMATGEVVIEGANGDGLTIRADDVTIEGFRIRASAGHGIRLQDTFSNVLVCNELLENEHNGISIHYGSGHTLQRNIVRGNRANGVALHATSDIQIENNLVFGNIENGIRSYWGISGLVALYNTVDAHRSALRIGQDFGNHTLIGNIFKSDIGYALYVGGSESLSSDNNVLVGDLLTEADGLLSPDAWRALGLDPGSIFSPAEPLWVDAAAGNYRLVPSSPAIDLVPPETEVPVSDLLGTDRPQGARPDAGAIEWYCEPAPSDPCNGIDDDCDGQVDEDLVPKDNDGDGIGDGKTACDLAHPTSVRAQGDCDDDNPRIGRCKARLTSGCQTIPDAQSGAGIAALLLVGAWRSVARHKRAR